MKRGTKILLFSLLGGGTLTDLICAGLIYVGFKAVQEFPKVIASGDAFLDQVKADKVDEAYKSTTPEFQAKVSSEQFRELLAKYPALTKWTTRTMSGMRIYGTGVGVRGYVQYALSNANNSLSLSLTLKDENGSWKVESVNLP